MFAGVLKRFISADHDNAFKANTIPKKLLKIQRYFQVLSTINLHLLIDRIILIQVTYYVYSRKLYNAIQNVIIAN